jgi:hypothetical protein
MLPDASVKGDETWKHCFKPNPRSVGECHIAAPATAWLRPGARVRQGKRFEVELDGPADEAAVTAITNLARDLLSNPVIEDFTLHAGGA